MLAIACLLLLPIALGYLTSWRMAVLREALRREEEEVARLASRYHGLREELRRARSLKRQHEVRRAFVTSDIQSERRKLEALRRPSTSAESVRIAA